MTIREFGTRCSLRRVARVGLMAAVGMLVGVASAEAQLGSRTFSNSRLSLDAGQVGDQLGISSSDRTTQKMELTRELQYLEPQRWQATSVTWLRFRQDGDGEILVTEMGPGVVQEVEASKKWQIEPIEGGGWKLTSDKGGGKLDLYLETVFNGKPFSVGAVVPKFEGEAYGAVYRGVDFLFFVVQKKHPQPAAAG